MVDGDQRVGGRCAQSLGRGRVAPGAAGQVEGQLRTSDVGADQRQADKLRTKWEGGDALVLKIKRDMVVYVWAVGSAPGGRGR